MIGAVTFDDVIWTLEHNACGGFVEADISVSPSGDEMRSRVASFCGNLEIIKEKESRDDELDLRIQLDEGHKSPRGTIRLRKSTFQRAEHEHCDDIPWTLRIWQRGVRISLDIYGSPVGVSSTESATAVNDEIPF